MNFNKIVPLVPSDTFYLQSETGFMVSAAGAKGFVHVNRDGFQVLQECNGERPVSEITSRFTERTRIEMSDEEMYHFLKELCDFGVGCLQSREDAQNVE